MKKLLELALEYQKLNNQFSRLSCLNFSNEYDRMDDLRALMMQECEHLTENNDMSYYGLYTAVESLASDIADGNISETATATLYSRDEFIDLLSKSMTYKEAERFKDMFNWMQEEDGKGYIETRFILEFENDRNHNKQYYYDKRMSCVIVVG